MTTRRMGAVSVSERPRGLRSGAPGPFTSIGIVGVGLVGGSLLRALAAVEGTLDLVAIDADPATREAIARESLASVVSADVDDALGMCDVVVLATPIGTLEKMLGRVSAAMYDGAVLTDVAGVKTPILEAAKREVRAGVAFVGGHPMFGGERGGFGESRADRWRGGRVAVCTDAAERWAIDRVISLHRLLGAEIVECTADAHDRAVAAVSHLPYVVASALALVAKDAGPLAEALAGKGFADATRLAGFSYDVQGEVARRNPHLGKEIARVTSAVAAIARGLSGSSDDARRSLEAARSFVDRRGREPERK